MLHSASVGKDAVSQHGVSVRARHAIRSLYDLQLDKPDRLHTLNIIIIIAGAPVVQYLQIFSIRMVLPADNYSNETNEY